MKQERFIFLINQYADKAISAEEMAELKDLLAGLEQTGLPEILSKKWLNESSFLASTQVDDEEIDNQVETILKLDKDFAPQPNVSPVYPMRFLRRWGWAAAIIVLLGTGAYLWTNKIKNTGTTAVAHVTKDIAPGKKGAILILDNGSQVLLDSIKNSVVALQGGVTARVINGELVYEGVGNKAVYNVMTTPKGRQYRVTLSDGTQVWLNAASSIRYPTVFNGSERNVEITGEAYFEVARNKNMPFKLKANNKAAIEVLGTQFNVNAYDDEESINTTLVEGSVRVIASAPGTAAILQPGQQARINNESKPNNPVQVINNIDVARIVAWKNGVFNFNDVTVADAMRQIARWYDVEIVYEKGVLQEELFGEMDRQLTLQDLLKGLSGVAANFRLDGKKLYVSPL